MNDSWRFKDKHYSPRLPRCHLDFFEISLLLKVHAQYSHNVYIQVKEILAVMKLLKKLQIKPRKKSEAPTGLKLMTN